MSEDNRTQNAQVVDKHVGQRLRLLRIMNGLSQGQLAKSLNLTFQQVQKYEKGMNRLSATRVFECAVLFGVEPNFFYDGLSPEMALNQPSGFVVKRLHDEGPFDIDRNLKLIAAYEAIEDQVVRDQVFTLIKTLGRQKENKPD